MGNYESFLGIGLGDHVKLHEKTTVGHSYGYTSDTIFKVVDLYRNADGGIKARIELVSGKFFSTSGFGTHNYDPGYLVWVYFDTIQGKVAIEEKQQQFKIWW